MRRLWRDLRGLVPWCALVVCLSLLLASEGRWGLLSAFGANGAPSTTATTTGYETAWHPYRAVDASGIWSVCVSSASGRIWTPFIDPAPTSTPNPAAAANPAAVANYQAGGGL